MVTTGPGNAVYIWRFDGVPEVAGRMDEGGMDEWAGRMDEGAHNPPRSPSDNSEAAEMPRAVPPTPSARAALQVTPQCSQLQRGLCTPVLTAAEGGCAPQCSQLQRGL